MADQAIPRGHPSNALPKTSYNETTSLQDGTSRLTLSHLKDLTMQKVQEVKERKRILKPRGPKPEVPAAPTRRQERNRLAQQALRDRRAQYLLFLEQSFTNLQEENTKLARANQELQRKLGGAPSSSVSSPPQGNIAPGQDTKQMHFFDQPSSSNGESSMASPPVSVILGDNTSSAVGNGFLSPAAGQPYFQDLTAPSPINGLSLPPVIDHISIASSMILALEHLCIDHVQPHAIRKFHDSGSAHGHAMMLITPSASLIQNFPDNEYYTPNNAEIEATLKRLLTLSGKLDLESDKITPVMAWKKLELHPKFGELREADFVTLKEVLEKDVRCHGFGAVFELKQFDNALDRVLQKKLS